MPSPAHRIPWMDWLPLAVTGILAPLLLFPSVRFMGIWLIIPATWIIRGLRGRSSHPRTPLDASLILLAGQIFLTSVFVADIELSLPKIAGVFLGIALLYALQPPLRKEEHLRLGIGLYLAGGLLFAVFSPLGMIRYNVKHLDGIFRLSNLIPKLDFNLPGAEAGFHPNAIGGTLVLFIPLFFCLLPIGHRDRRHFDSVLWRVFPAGGFLISVTALVLTQSRGSWIGLFLICPILLLSLPSKKIRNTGLIAFLVLLLALAYFGIDIIPQSFQEVGHKVETRLELWKIGSKTVQEHPFLGIGLNHLRASSRVGYRTAHAHNHFLHTAAEIGIPGLLFFTAVLIGAGYMGYRTWRISISTWIKRGSLGLTCGLFAQIIFGIFDSIPLGAKVGLFFWLNLALVAALYNHALTQDSLP